MTIDTELSGLTLTVHIGTGKTGSSSIQRSLAAVQPLLEDQAGTAYLGLMGEYFADRQYAWQDAGGWPLLAALQREEAGRQLGDMLAGALLKARGAGLHHVIWSNESIFGNHHLVLPVVRHLMGRGAAVRGVVYVRRHDEWARSAYLQWAIKHKVYSGRLRSFEEWGASNPVSFFGGLEPWLETLAPALFCARNYGACTDVVADFLQCCGLSHLAIASIRENETPSPVALALWALHNGQKRRPVLPMEFEPVLAGSGLIESSPRTVRWNALIPTDEALQSVVLACAEDRDRLNAVLAAQGQPPLATGLVAHKSLRVTPEQIHAALLRLIERQSEEIDHLRRSVDALTARLDRLESPDRLHLDVPPAGG